MEFDTKTVHAGQKPDSATGALATPIYQTSTFAQEAPNQHKGFDYSRTANPTRKVLEDNVAALENARFGLTFSSGLAATNAVMNLLQKGDRVVSSYDVYGGTYRLFKNPYENYGIGFAFVDATDTSAVRAALEKAPTKLVWIETPTNPLLKVSDIAAIAKAVHEKEALLAVDGTLATPYLQQPLTLGADIVVHSTTKYMNGHGDVIGGALALNNEETYKRLKFYQNAVGAVPSPFDAWLTLRGIKTLSLRMARHSENAQKVAEFLEQHPNVKKVHYPGLHSHPQHALAKKQMKAFGGLMSVELDASLESAMAFASTRRFFTLAEDLGGVRSLACHPASMTHADIPREKRLEAGLTDGLIRLSIGIEDVQDLIEDLKAGLDNV